MCGLRTILTVFLLLSPLGLVSAHPHMWIRGQVLPVLGNRGLSAVDIQWTFDEYNSSRYIRDYDADGNGRIDAGETTTLRTESLSRLYRYEYYLIVDVDGLRGMPLEAVNFQASIVDGRLVYAFRVPLEITIRWEDIDKVGIYLFDPSYFVDFRSDGGNDQTFEIDGRTVRFTTARRELETQGYGKVAVTGLQAGVAGYGGSTRVSMSAWLKDRGYLIQERLAAYTRRVVREGEHRALWAALGLSFVFGLIHVIGPGHGKVFTLAYFSSKQARIGEGLALSALINALDSLSAFLLIGLTYGVLSMTIQQTGVAASRITRLVAYGAISLIGIGHLLAPYLRRRREPTAPKRSLKPWTLALSVGLIPCPVSTALLAYGMAEGTMGFSLLLVVGVSLGGVVALSLYSILIIAGKAGLVRLVEQRSASRILEFFEAAAMGLLVVFGVLMFIATL